MPITHVLQYAIQRQRFAMNQKTNAAAWTQFIERGQYLFHGFWWFQPAGINQSKSLNVHNVGVLLSDAIIHAGRASIRRTISLAVSAMAWSAMG